MVGHSLGGMIGIELAARHPSVPGAVAAVDPGPINPLPETRKIFEDLESRLRSPDGEAARREYVEATTAATADTVLKEWIVETMCAVPLPIAEAVIRGVIVWDGVEALRKCDVPRSSPTSTTASPSARATSISSRCRSR